MTSPTPDAPANAGRRAEGRRTWWRTVLTVGPGAAWLVVFLLLPLGAVAVTSFLSRGDYGEIGRPGTLENYRRLAGFGALGFDSLYPAILGRSLLLGAATAAACLAGGLPLAFFIAGLPARWKTPALTLVVIPFWTNLLIRTYAWQLLLGPGGWITRLVHAAGIGAPGEPLYPGVFAVGLGMVCDYLPFLVLPLYASVEKLDWSLADAARDLGASGSRVFRHALWPQILPGVRAGWVLVFLPATGQFVIPDLLGGAKTVLLGGAIDQQFRQSRDWPFGAAIALAALVLVLFGMAWSARRQPASPGTEAVR